MKNTHILLHSGAALSPQNYLAAMCTRASGRGDCVNDDREVVERVREGNDLVELVSEYVTLKEQGSNMVALCPFHDERTPSFTVDPDRELYYCFGCHAGGDIFNFVMEMEGASFVEALQILADRAGISIPRRGKAGRDEPSREQKVREYLFRVGRFAASFFAQQLQREDGMRAAKYLRGRGISESMQKEYMLGYAPDSWDALIRALRSRGVKLKAAELLGLVKTSERTGNYFDVFRDRIVFPICDFRGRVVGFAGRVVDEGQPKYLNSPENPIFNKGSIWYGLDRAKKEIRRRSRVIVVEGYMDVLACVAHGWPEAVASMGTAITPNQVHILDRYADEALMAYDADGAGTDAVMRSISSFAGSGMSLKVVRLPEGKDPDDVLSAADGEEVFARYIEEAQSSFEFAWDEAQRKHDIAEPEGKAEALREVADMIMSEPDAVVRGDRIRVAAQRLKVPERAVRDQLRRWSRKGREHKRSADRHNTKENYGTEPLQQRSTAWRAWRAEREILRLIMHRGEFFARVRQDLRASDFEDESHRRVLETILEMREAQKDDLLDAVIRNCEEEEDRRLAARLAMEEVPPGRSDRAFADCVQALMHRRKHRRVEELSNIMQEKERRGEKIPSEILKEQMDLLTELKVRR